MEPTERYELNEGEWHEQPPHISYACDRSGLIRALNSAMRASAWTHGETKDGPEIIVDGHKLDGKPQAKDINKLSILAQTAPYGRGEDTVYDRNVRDARQIDAQRIEITGEHWAKLKQTMKDAIASEMALDDTDITLTLLKMLLYNEHGHFADHADTEKVPGMVASAVIILPGRYEGGTLVIEHGDQSTHIATDGSDQWRWAAWYADCHHRLEPVRQGTRIALTLAVSIRSVRQNIRHDADDGNVSQALWNRVFAEQDTKWAARSQRINAGTEQYGQKIVWVLSHRYSDRGLKTGLLKGRDRELVRLLMTQHEREACHTARLQIREIGEAMTDDNGNTSFGDHAFAGYEVEKGEGVQDADTMQDEPHVSTIEHQSTPKLHIKNITRANYWLENLRTLDGAQTQYGPIEVLDGEIAPEGALAQVMPTGARVYEATGNEGASLELQYHCAVIVMWSNGESTLTMLARTGGRRALATEMKRLAGLEGVKDYGNQWTLRHIFALWGEAMRCDGGNPAPETHESMLAYLKGNNDNETVMTDLRNDYIAKVATIDLVETAAPVIRRWIADKLEGGQGLGKWSPWLGEIMSMAHKPQSGTGKHPSEKDDDTNTVAVEEIVRISATFAEPTAPSGTLENPSDQDRDIPTGTST